jgi:hypothetical protein
VDSTPLHGGRIVVIADRDEPGGRHARDVVESLEGKVSPLRVVHAKVGKDAADHIAAGHRLDELLETDPLETPLDEVLNIITASDVNIRRVAYLWERRIPIGAMTLMPGEEGIGKTTVGVRIIADLTRGALPGEHSGKPQHVLIIGTEDGIEDVFTPRLKEAGADLGCVHFIRARITFDGSSDDVILPRDLQVIGRAVDEYGAAFIWIDSLVTRLPDEMKSIAYKDTAKVLKKISSGPNSSGSPSPHHGTSTNLPVRTRRCG